MEIRLIDRICPLYFRFNRRYGLLPFYELDTFIFQCNLIPLVVMFFPVSVHRFTPVMMYNHIIWSVSGKIK